VPQRKAPHVGQLVEACGDRCKVIAGELACLAREANGAVGEKDFGLTNRLLKKSLCELVGL
jgi:hypothetical protein